MNIILFFNRISPWISIIFSFCLLLLVALFDDFSGYEIGISFFYLIPISLATLRFGKKGGFTFAFLGSIFWVLSDIDSGHHYSHFFFPYLNGLNRLGVFLAVAYLLGSLRGEWEKEARKSRRDPLTDVLNRRAFLAEAGKKLEMKPDQGSGFAIGYLDLDNFKGTNDTYGHSTGDMILQKFAGTLRQVRHPDYVLGRLGGDEFVLLLAQVDGEKAKEVFEALRLEVAEQLKSVVLGVTVSIGLAYSKDASQDLSLWIKQADKLMYESKKSGKNKVSCSEFSVS